MAVLQKVKAYRASILNDFKKNRDNYKKHLTL